MAVKDAIIVTTLNKALGSQVVSSSTQLRNVKTQINDLASILAHMTDGVDFVMIESQLGLATGDGTKLYTLINTLQTQINGSGAVADFSTKIISAS